MRLRAAFLLLLLGLVTTIASAQPPKRVALVGGQLLTGYEVPPIHHAAVVVEGTKIVGDLRGLSSPSVTDMRTMRSASPRS